MMNGKVSTEGVEGTGSQDLLVSLMRRRTKMNKKPGVNTSLLRRNINMNKKAGLVWIGGGAAGTGILDSTARL